MNKREAFMLGAGGCRCPSCSHTAEFQAKGFAAWPRGNPAGRRSAADYAAHVAYSRTGAGNGFHFEVTPDPVYARLPGLVMPIPQNVIAVRWNSQQKSKGRISPADARPLQGSSPAAHFPERDRPLETAKIYAMPKAQAKRPVGRPAMDGRRVVVKLDERHIKLAEAVGDGNVAAGIRRALDAAQTRKRA